MSFLLNELSFIGTYKNNLHKSLENNQKNKIGITLKKIILITSIILNFTFAINLAEELNNLFVSVAEQGKPAVVSIISEKTVTQKNLIAELENFDESGGIS